MSALKKLQEIYLSFCSKSTKTGDELDYMPKKRDIAQFLQSVSVDARAMTEHELVLRKLFSPRNNTLMVETYLRSSQDLKDVFMTFKNERELLCRLITESLDKIRDS